MVLILFLDAPMELLGVCNGPTTSHPPLYYDMSNIHGTGGLHLLGLISLAAGNGIKKPEE